MWVTFFIDETSEEKIIFSKYQVQDEAAVDLPRELSSEELVNLVVEKAAVDTTELRRKGAVKVNLRVLEPARRKDSGSRSSTDEVSLVLKALQRQQEQMVQQNQIMTSLISSLNAEKPMPKFVEPDAFDGVSSSPESWLDFYEYAAGKNKWLSDEAKITNMRVYLRGVARKWYETCILEDSDDSWSQWRKKFLTAFRSNPVERWNTALNFKSEQSCLVEYFFEKRRLLKLAEPLLPSTAVVALIMHGLHTNVLKQVQILSPKTLDDLLACLQNIPSASETSITAESSSCFSRSKADWSSHAQREPSHLASSTDNLPWRVPRGRVNNIDTEAQEYSTEKN
ncbi:uncharacterized protein LOC125758462 [Rhipicephalus sanguineus]|uniref:uncharacterized protein LOC125758462 n=1 Tax=Rhipicephalus sanguineus TaxID=34632 RepID=UPI0020C3A559|nr:uncharacterized protein LOC125758462 [Rhipicephalus sanguineus]